MSHSKSQLLNLISRPAFFAVDGKISQANTAAQALMLLPGTEVFSLLQYGQQELQAMTQGSLCTALNFGGILRQVSITPEAEGLLFLLDSREDAENLQALALAAQQLRGPLGEALGAATALAPNIASHNAEVTNQLWDMYRGLMQLLRIVGNMSDAQQLLEGQTGPRENCELGSFFHGVFQKVAELAEPMNIHISFEAPKKEVYAFADPQQLERCILNLLSNSLRFTPKGGFIRGQLHATARHAIVRIADSGEGLHEEVQTALFSRYTRAPGMEDSRYGLGLGLLVSRLIASAHGGALLIGPRPEGGTEVAVSISLEQPQEGSLRSPLPQIDYTGHWDHTLVELSRELPREAMEYL